MYADDDTKHDVFEMLTCKTDGAIKLRYTFQMMHLNMGQLEVCEKVYKQMM